MEIINGPIAPVTAGGIIYQVTLSSGMIVTSPEAFGVVENKNIEQPLIIGDGRVLINPVKVKETKATTP